MSTIKVNCVDQVLTYTNTPVVASGATNEDSVQFDFDSTWDGYSKVAVFYQQKGRIYYSLVGENDLAKIPAEVMAASGTTCLGVMGVNGNVTRTSEVLRYRVTNGALDGITVEAPSEDIYQQLLTTWTEIKALCNDTKAAQAAFIERMTTDVAAAMKLLVNWNPVLNGIPELTAAKQQVPGSTRLIPSKRKQRLD